MDTTISTGTKVSHTNSRGDVDAAIVIDQIPADAFGEPLVVIEFTDRPLRGIQQRVKPSALTVLA